MKNNLTISFKKSSVQFRTYKTIYLLTVPLKYAGFYFVESYSFFMTSPRSVEAFPFTPPTDNCRFNLHYLPYILKLLYFIVAMQSRTCKYIVPM